MYIYFARSCAMMEYQILKDLIFLLFSSPMKRSRFLSGIKKLATGQMGLFYGITMSFAFRYCQICILFGLELEMIGEMAR